MIKAWIVARSHPFILGFVNGMSVWYRPNGPAASTHIIETFSSLARRGLVIEKSPLLDGGAPPADLSGGRSATGQSGQ
ncbi:hypothetical protein [Bradyrhizobium valentinum]|uniref:HTH-type transcriptional repressor KstR2 C-terminal domain-containing protein n=1 Tax=Bradyrhizobium valentinum TaxID=1518501 RepID=A0A0R3L6M4_9BRAD|nr:hypothetical protein CP49_25215 [Bradyrhizobium valentinum]